MKRFFNRTQRATARLAVVQAIFSYKMSENKLDVQDVLKFFDPIWEKPDIQFMEKRFKSIYSNIDKLTDYLTQGLQSGWTLERLDPVLYSILIVSTDEMISELNKTPPEILIKEYVDLTGDFFDQSETSFVNAYLNDLKSKLNTKTDENL